MMLNWEGGRAGEGQGHLVDPSALGCREDCRWRRVISQGACEGHGLDASPTSSHWPPSVTPLTTL